MTQQNGKTSTNLNSSLMALVIAGSATTYANPAQTLPTNRETKTFRSTCPARYLDSGVTPSKIDGHLYLDLYKSEVSPVELNNIVSEFQGNLYLKSTEKNSRGEYDTMSLGGEDGNVILDLINKAKPNEPWSKDKYQFHGCNSTTTDCEAMALRLNVKDGKLSIHGTLSGQGYGIEVLENQEWSNSGWDCTLEEVSTTSN